MKITCHCGALIIDQTDELPHKGHLIPDQECFATYDAIDDHVIDPVADGRLGREAAYREARKIIRQPTRLMYQCRSCGRLYIDDPKRELHCFVPESEQTSREILRSRPTLQAAD